MKYRYLHEYKGDFLAQIAMPMGGIGTGCICLNGFGGLQDFAIRNNPATTALPDTWAGADAAFGMIRIKSDRPVTKLLEGPYPLGRVYDQGLKAQGLRDGGHDGFPRFGSARFYSGYPMGQVVLSDPNVPLDVSLRGYNPFIPGDDKNSGIPCAILEYTFRNPTTAAVSFDFSYHVSHFYQGTGGDSKKSRSIVTNGFGIHFTNIEPATSEHFASAALGVIGHTPRIKGQWYRGGWFDSISALWHELSNGKFSENRGNPDRDIIGRNGGSVLVELNLAPGESANIPIVITWYCPNVHWDHVIEPSTKPTEPGTNPPPRWKPYYTTLWTDAMDVAEYVRENYSSLRQRTETFRDALLSSTLPIEALDAISSNLAIMKSPTVLRQSTGNLWAWEGCFTTTGSCPGTCTHVWNYAQAFPHLFPNLERTLREQEYLRSMSEEGHVNFRAALPDGPNSHGFHPAADGQLGGIMKLYRDWQISGDRAWLAAMYPLAKRSLDYCINRWDPDRRGALFEPHHNTYDIEFWGPDGMCTSVYIGALSAAAAMAQALGDAAGADAYLKLAAKGAAYMDESLFNGEYFIQRVQWAELKDQSFTKQIAAVADDSDDLLKLLKAEGPKYQYGNGCISDGVIGAWMARIYGIETPLNVSNVRKHLSAIFKHNFKRDLFDHACAQRPGYAIGHEAGLLLCTWPRGGKPTLPFVYSDEVWTGIEYQVASHLIEEGMVEEGLSIVRGARSRYDGRVRNPFNEYECGSYYARALASYALLGSLSGFGYSAVTQVLRFGPKLEARPFTTFFATASGFGTITLDRNRLSVNVIEGELTVKTLELSAGENARRLPWTTVVKAGETKSLRLESEI
jgi:uncharacterized protein (DUF608 family)